MTFAQSGIMPILFEVLSTATKAETLEVILKVFIISLTSAI